MLLNTLLLFFLFLCCTSMDTITPNQYIKDGNTIVSKEMKFELGFFSPGNSTHRYVGIWYPKIAGKPVVWVANRDNPINDSSGVLTINRYGNLVLYAYNKEDLVIWSTKVSVQSTSTSAQLFDTGNLVLAQGDNNGEVLWQSFDYPTDTMLPGMKLGLNRKTGLDWFLTSWKSQDDPGIGNYSYRLNTNGSPQFFLYKGSTQDWRTASWPWRIASRTTTYVYTYRFVNNQDETYMIDFANNTSEVSRLTVNYDGTLQRLTWNDAQSQWKEIWGAPKYRCDHYGQCGAFSTCSPDNIQFQCECLPGYQPRSSGDWYQGDGSDGCMSKRAQVSKCGNGEGFVKVERVKLPDASISAWLNTKMSDKECRQTCLRNCSCVAFANPEIDGVGGCLAWHGELMDILSFSVEGRNLYVWADAIELGTTFLGSKFDILVCYKSFHNGIIILLIIIMHFKGSKLELQMIEFHQKWPTGDFILLGCIVCLL